jgi:UDP-perosamine 4-acetyltransferase
VLGALRDSAFSGTVALLDPDTAKHGTSLLDAPIIGDDSAIATARQQGFTHFVITVGALQQPTLRARLFQQYRASGLLPYSFTAASAVISSHATLDSGVTIMPSVTINAAAHIGDNVIINSGALIEHDAHIAAHAHIAPRAVILGNVHVGEGAFIGAGAILKQGVTIGDYAVVGAGAFVNTDVQAHTTVVGTPARQKL